MPSKFQFSVRLFFPVLILTVCFLGDIFPSEKTAGEKEKLIYITGFEKPFIPICSFNGPLSKISYRFITNIVHSGKYALEVKTDTEGYSGVSIEDTSLPPRSMDWTEMKTLNLWIDGSAAGEVFYIKLVDRGHEEFMYLLVDNWKGWKRISIPLDKFHSRVDWQPENAMVNRKIDYPLKTLHIVNFYNSKATLVVDDIDVSSE